jgi:protein tyrosine phosphatase
MSHSPVPSWLQKAYNQDHINQVWRMLADRERSRHRARSLSTSRPYRPQSDIAPTATTHLPNATDYYAAALGCSSENSFCNRYIDIIPYDRTRIDAGGRYLNANWVRELAGGHWTIATQAPLPNTAHEFLSLIAGIHPPFGPPGEPALRFARVRTIVQLTRNVESGRQKAHPYFPHEPGDSWVVSPPPSVSGLPPLQVTLVKSEVIESAQCVGSTVSVVPVVAGTSCPALIFHHLSYAAWPDHGIPEPEHRAGLLNFIRLVDQKNKDMRGLEVTADVEPPIMVHCSAGIGRTGSFIALSSLLRSNGLLLSPASQPVERVPLRPSPLSQSQLGPLPEGISWDEIAQEVDSLREQRPGMVQRTEQAVLVYEVLVAAFMTR